MAAELLGGIRHVLESGVHKIRQGFQIIITDPIWSDRELFKKLKRVELFIKNQKGTV
jgi:hypothetical protein